MASTPLATPSDAEAFACGDVSEPFLAKASVRVREFTKQQISAGISTVQAEGPTVRLAQRPVRSVLSVIDQATGKPAAHTLRGSVVDTGRAGAYLITYEHGFDPVPESVVELVCEIAARLQGLSPALRAGMQQGTAGSMSGSFGWDSHTGVANLTSAEKDRLRRLFPKVPRLIVPDQ